MSWAAGLIVVIGIAVLVPWVIAEWKARSRETFKPDPVARKHRAVVRRGFKSRAGIREQH